MSENGNNKVEEDKEEETEMKERYEFRVRVLQGYTPESGQEAIKKIQAEATKEIFSTPEYKELKKWAMKKNIFDDYCEEFAMTDCTICQKEIDFKCRLIAKRIVGECRGKIHETMAEANWPDNNRYEGLYKYYYRRNEEV